MPSNQGTIFCSWPANIADGPWVAALTESERHKLYPHIEDVEDEFCKFDHSRSGLHINIVALDREVHHQNLIQVPSENMILCSESSVAHQHDLQSPSDLNAQDDLTSYPPHVEMLNIINQGVYLSQPKPVNDKQGEDTS